MKACWPEGSLRAYHDGELLPADMERVAAHLAECPHCEALADEVAGRANRVAKLMSALPQTEQVIWMPRRAPVAARARVSMWPVWAGAAAALAAGVAIATWMAPKPAEYKAPAVTAAVTPEASEAIPVILPGVRQAAVQSAAPVSRRPARSAASPSRTVAFHVASRSVREATNFGIASHQDGDTYLSTLGKVSYGDFTLQGGYVALRATVAADAWLTVEKPIKFDLKTTTLDGEGQEAKGTLKVFALKQPATVARGDILGTPFYWRTRAGVVEDMPKPDPAKPISWELGDVVFGTDFATNGNGLGDTSTLLRAGIYRAVLETTDKFGKKVTARYQFTVVNPRDSGRP
jgi:hypothetical protein